MAFLNDDQKPSLDELTHFGVKGMHWGVRKGDHPDVSRAMNKVAKKDAQEFARAKMFYGEGAGTRRKLIKATVEGRSKNNADYKKAFDHHLANQDMSKHADKAKGERTRKNVVNSTAKTARGISHLLRGNSQYASAAAALLFGGAMAVHKAGIDRVVMNAAKTKYSQVKNHKNIKPGMPASDFLKNMGL